MSFREHLLVIYIKKVVPTYTMQHFILKALEGIMFDSATHPINVGTCAHNIFCFGGQVINHKYPKHKEEVEGLEKSNVQRNAIYIYYNKELHRKNNY